MVLRFAIGDIPAELERNIQQEEEASGAFLRIPGKVGATGAFRWAKKITMKCCSWLPSKCKQSCLSVVVQGRLPAERLRKVTC